MTLEPTEMTTAEQLQALIDHGFGHHDHDTEVGCPDGCAFDGNHVHLASCAGCREATDAPLRDC